MLISKRYGPLPYYYGPPAYAQYHSPAPRQLQIPSPVLVERKVQSILSDGWIRIVLSK